MILRRTKPTTRGFVPWDATCVLELPCWCWFRVSHRISTQFCTCEHLLCYAATSNASYVRVNIFRSLTELLPSHSEAVANERWNISTCVPRRSAREQIADGLRLNLHEFELRGQNFDDQQVAEERNLISAPAPDLRLILFRATLCNRAHNHQRAIKSAVSLIRYRKLVLASPLPVGLGSTTQAGEKHRKWERCRVTAFLLAAIYLFNSHCALASSSLTSAIFISSLLLSFSFSNSISKETRSVAFFLTS